MLLEDWRKSWRASRSYLGDVIAEMQGTKKHSSAEPHEKPAGTRENLSEVFIKNGIPPRYSLEICAADENSWAWVLHFLSEANLNGRSIAYMLPQREEATVQLSFNGAGETSCYYSVKGSRTLSSLAIRFMREKACDMLVFSPAAIEMKLLKLSSGYNGNEDAYNIAFGRAAMAIAHAASLYRVPVIFLRRMTHRNDSRGLSAVQCRIRVRSEEGRSVKILIEKDAAARNLTQTKKFPNEIDPARQLEMKYMLEI